MDITKHIASLLQTETEVTVNGLGAFRKVRTPGRFDRPTGSYLPPATSIGFSQDQGDSPVLARYIASSESITEEDAYQWINTFANDTQNTLNDTGAVALGELGTLHFQNGAYQLDSTTSGSNDDFFGFPPVQEQEDQLDQEDEEVQEDQEDQLDNRVQEDEGDQSDKIDQVEETEREDESDPGYQAQEAPDQPEEASASDPLDAYAENSQDVDAIETVQESEQSKREVEQPQESANGDQDIDAVESVQKETNPNDGGFHQPVSPTIETSETFQEEDHELTTRSQQDTDTYRAPRPAWAEQYDEDDNSKRGYIKWVLILFVLVAIGLTVYMTKPQLVNKYFGTPVDTAAMEPIPIQPDTTVQDSTFITAVADSLITQQDAVTQATTYEVIVSAENNPARINKMLLNYNKLGFIAKVIPGKVMQKISVASFSNRSLALDSLDGIKKKLNNPDAYIYTYNKK